MLDEILSEGFRKLTEKPITKVETCPNCFAAAIVIKSKKHKKFPYKVKCLNVFCGCQTKRYNDLDSAVRAWNKRETLSKPSD